MKRKACKNNADIIFCNYLVAEQLHVQSEVTKISHKHFFAKQCFLRCPKRRFRIVGITHFEIIPRNRTSQRNAKIALALPLCSENVCTTTPKCSQKI